jgi:hypothetical protein
LSPHKKRRPFSDDGTAAMAATAGVVAMRDIGITDGVIVATAVAMGTGATVVPAAADTAAAAAR